MSKEEDFYASIRAMARQAAARALPDGAKEQIKEYEYAMHILNMVDPEAAKAVREGSCANAFAAELKERLYRGFYPQRFGVIDLISELQQKRACRPDKPSIDGEPATPPRS